MFSVKSVNKRFLSVVSVVIAVFVVAALFYGMSGSALADTGAVSQQTKRTLNVNGQGKVTAVPDIAYVNLGVVTEHKDAAAAQANNSAAMDKVLNAVKSAGVAAGDLQTAGYSVYPKYNYAKETGESEIIGYTVNNSVKVTIRDISKVGKILEAASKSGANTSGGISFGVSDYEKYYNDALKNAVQAARKKAEVLAGAAGVTIGTPVSITESGGYNPAPMYEAYGKGMAMDSAAVPIESGTFEITANISLVYEY